jgi:predicted RNA-binding Zn-ribbon protein involved in translation (DUF1610 family)
VGNEALELVVRGKEQAVAFACPSCGAVFPSRVEGAENLAREHCSRFCRCGAALFDGLSLCTSCTDKERADRESRLFETAKKVSVEDYPDEPVYWEGQAGSMGLGFFLNIDELLDYCEEEELDHPKYVWACTPRPLQVLTGDVLEAAIYEHNVGLDDLDACALGNLETFLATWCKEQNLRTWFPDFERAVLLLGPSPAGG